MGRIASDDFRAADDGAAGRHRHRHQDDAVLTGSGASADRSAARSVRDVHCGSRPTTANLSRRGPRFWRDPTDGRFVTHGSWDRQGVEHLITLQIDRAH